MVHPIKDQLQQWKEKLHSFTELQLPTDYARPLPLRVVDADLVRDLPADICVQLLQLSLATDEQPFTLLMAVFAALLHRYTGEEDIVIVSSSSSGNPVILRFPVRSNDTFVSLVNTVARVERDAHENEVRFEDLHPQLPATPKVRFFNGVDTPQETSTFLSQSSDISVFVTQSPTVRRLLPLEIRMVYNTVLFTSARIESIFDHIESLTRSFCSDPALEIDVPGLLAGSTVVPDPLLDLVDWKSDWPGAITEIFAQNAARNPDAPCIVEYHDAGKAPTSLTYLEVDQASSALAQRFIADGIRQEDVIVIYAHRSADLAVAIMGVLKAGATFCVVDPQYPPTRQQVYLSVAKPSGLVVLEKAGKLDLSIETFIESEQDFVLRCRIDSYSMAAIKYREGDHRGLPTLRPDSIGTLSFTSGSTGIPKGVRGRHYSLTRFFPWMAKEFGLSNKDRFTMLSGIAHDPIQRDIFTPLFFGAQIHVPTAEDIGQPGRLAEWMAESECTVTHLTPAMGQLLSANASTQIPNLRNAFFVGDILTKRDVTRLQALATRVSVINMYGTTETQRAVSYFCVPNRSNFLNNTKDVLPAGRGMQGVQLLVVNKRGQMCGVGEVGEIYVRSLGLAEGYLGKGDETRKKFVSNFFATPYTDNEPVDDSVVVLDRGARDRMYKTGDLGRYQPDGTVECSGRADDQVKIRGFRIELREIDTHLSRSQYVRENITLVRRDAYEEKTLVAYVVLHSEAVQAHDVNTIISWIRMYLKQKLPSYSVPSIIVPLKKMPLTPNGKVDKNALPFPNTVLDPSGHLQSGADMTSVERTLSKLWNEVLHRSVSVDENFFDVGGHSILATQLIFKVRQAFKLDGELLPLNLLFRCPTVRQMAAEIESSVGFGVVQDTTKTTEEKTDTVECLDLQTEVCLPAEICVSLGSRFSTQNPDMLNCNGLFRPKSVFLTGATGFLGAFILHWVISTFGADTIVHCLVRAESEQDAISRLEKNLAANSLSTSIENIRIVVGDLGKDRFGMSSDSFSTLASSIDVVIHNGAFVHWVYPYQKLKAANVGGTVEALRLCTTGDVVKPIVFVSSTSVLDTAAYTQKLSTPAVLESDDLEGSRFELKTGYGQSKWVAERLIMEARRRGIPTSILRPGYILGDSSTGVCNTDDFLWRLMKGCIQLGKVPVINNVVNALPVDFVARSVVEIVGRLPESNGRSAHDRAVFHGWNDQNYRFIDFFRALIEFGHEELQDCAYLEWRDALMDLTMQSGPENALYPLLHFVLDDLPTSTNSPPLDHANLKWALEGSQVHNMPMKALMRRYLNYLTRTGFMPVPTSRQSDFLGSTTAAAERICRSGH